MEAVVRYDDEPFRHTGFPKPEQFGEIKEENSENTSEIMTHSHTETSKSSRSSSDDLFEVVPIIIPKSPQTKPPKPQEMSSDDDDGDYCRSGHLFELPREILIQNPTSAQMMERSRKSDTKSPQNPVLDWSMVSNDSLFSLPIGSHSFSRDWFKPGEMRSSENDEIEWDLKKLNENFSKMNLRVQWNDPNVKTYSFTAEDQDTSQPSAFSMEKFPSPSPSSSSQSSCICSDSSFCAFFSSCKSSCLNCCAVRPCSCKLLCVQRYCCCK